MKPVHRRPSTVSIIPERKHGRPAGTRLITRSTTVRPFVYTLPSSDHSEKPASGSKKSKVENQENVAGAYNSSISHLDNSLANKIAISNDSLYCTTPNKSISPSKQRCTTRSLLREFELTQDDAGSDMPKISNVQTNELQLKARKSLSTEESFETGSLKSFKRDTALLTHPQKISNTSQSQQCNQLPQEESIILKRKSSSSTNVAVSHESLQTRHSKRNLLLKQNSNISHSDIFENSSQEKVVINRKRKNSINIAVSHEMSVVVSKTSVTTKSHSICSSLTKGNSVNHVMISQQSSSIDTNLTPEQSTRFEQTSLLSAITAEENHSLTNTSAKSKTSSTFAIEGPREADSTYGNINETFRELVNCQSIKLKKCSVVLDYLPLSSKHLEKTVEEFSSESKQNENSGKLNCNETLNERPTIDGENIENKKEGNTVTDDRCFIKVNKNNEQELLLAESKSPTRSATSFPRVLLENISQLKNQSECLATSNDNVEENKEKDVTGEHLKVNKNNEQEPLLSRSKTSERSAASFSHVLLENTSQLKKSENLDSHVSHQIPSDNTETISHSISVNIDNAQEQLSLVKSVTSLQAPLESISQLKNQSENAEETNTLIKISEISSPSLSDHRETLSKPSPTVENISSEKVQHQNLVSNNRDSESLIFEQTGTSLPQGKGLRHPSSEHFTYNAIVGVRRTSSRQPRKPKHKTKPEDCLNYTVDQQPLFEGHKKIKIWKGETETRNRSLSDLTDLDIALNVIEQVIEEISKEDQSKQDLLRVIQENYNSSLHAMIMKVQSIKRKNKEIKELMATVKEVASELDHTVDNKIRLQSKILELKAQQKTSNAIADGPTWQDMNYL